MRSCPAIILSAGLRGLLKKRREWPCQQEGYADVTVLPEYTEVY